MSATILKSVLTEIQKAQAQSGLKEGSISIEGRAQQAKRKSLNERIGLLQISKPQLEAKH